MQVLFAISKQILLIGLVRSASDGGTGNLLTKPLIGKERGTL